ncbi:unnamed protein product [Clonostachys rhizophaga]|uniref:Uncharacterized protein n=1 Tax=Clonostachys rhizophaga TaxID=160324 RepID=A0A9N9V3M4_9HYPO|nr:unnamed protein product [Clonostachys rhizophaga]
MDSQATFIPCPVSYSMKLNINDETRVAKKAYGFVAIMQTKTLQQNKQVQRYERWPLRISHSCSVNETRYWNAGFPLHTTSYMVYAIFLRTSLIVYSSMDIMSSRESYEWLNHTLGVYEPIEQKFGTMPHPFFTLGTAFPAWLPSSKC